MNIKKILVAGVATVALIAPLASNPNVSVNASHRVRIYRVGHRRVPAWIVRKVNRKYSGDTRSIRASQHEIRAMKRNLRHARTTRRNKRHLRRELDSAQRRTDTLSNELTQLKTRAIKLNARRHFRHHHGKTVRRRHLRARRHGRRTRRTRIRYYY